MELFRRQTAVFAPVVMAMTILATTLFAMTTPARAQKAGNSAPTAVGGGSGLIVGGVAVDVNGKNPTDARNNGWREAQRKAWPALWERMSGRPASTAPRLGDGVLDSMVSAIEIEHEEVGPNRYVGRLAVVFDRARAGSYLGRFADVQMSPPLLVIPVLQDAAARYSYEPDSPWLKAWARLRAGESAIDYVRIQPTPGDTVLLSAWQASRSRVLLWRNLVDRYQVADVLIPELILDRSFDGGPVSAILIVRFGTAGRELARYKFTNAAGNVDSLMDDAVRLADRVYITELRSGNLIPDPSLIEAEAPVIADTGPAIGAAPSDDDAVYQLTLRAQTPDDDAIAALERKLRQTPGIASVRVASFAPGGESVFEIGSASELDALRYGLDTQGLRIDGNVLRARRADEAPLPPPVVAEDGVVESDDQAPPAAQPAAQPASRPAPTPPAAEPKASPADRQPQD